MAALAVADEISVFADTNLGTRIALNVPQDITAGAFKRNFERVHFSCLPNSGKIQVNGLMVKRRSCFYYLPDSLPLKYVFNGMRSTWFLHVEASHSKNLCVPHSPDSFHTTRFKPQDLINSNANDDKTRDNSEDCTVRIVKEKKCAVVMPESEVQISVKLNANSMQGSPSEMSAEVLSVTGIIDKYFPPTGKRIDNLSSPSYSDVTSRVIYEEVADQPNMKPFETPPRNVSCAPSLHVNLISGTSQDKRRKSKPRKPLLHINSVSGTSQDKRRESKLRKRFLAASQCLGVSPNKQSPTLSFCGYKDEKLSLCKSQNVGSLFEISDNDD